MDDVYMVIRNDLMEMLRHTPTVLDADGVRSLIKIRRDISDMSLADGVASTNFEILKDRSTPVTGHYSSTLCGFTLPVTISSDAALSPFIYSNATISYYNPKVTFVISSVIAAAIRELNNGQLPDNLEISYDLPSTESMKAHYRALKTHKAAP